ncbi:hypothetical protein [Arenimonas composti]|uniref:Uncharacterized protein n=1 Tax=Arenimonas composti TR7-09 = DSM 18010 TaxID=1121013 RepID=A0A091C1Z6_9GAMM|nr:hypothetical protein [Arenimonas composti]KFN50665.1 hypothetical protein P873_05755 [Arenimonas composti TR7-09 = DSM 18010]
MDAFANPFHVLGASPRDRKSRLLELAEELSLHGDAEVAANARNVLINPRNRLAAEVAWFPGVAPARVGAALQAVRDTGRHGGVAGLPPLAAANLELAQLAGRDRLDAGWLRDAILRVAEQVERIDPAAVLTAINEDRQVAGFPAVADAAAVEAELAERVRHFQRVLTGLLDRLTSAEMVATYEQLIEMGSDGGRRAAPRLVGELLAGYELHAGEHLAAEATRILAMVEETKAAADAKFPVDSAVRGIAAAIVDWDRIAQPIQRCRQVAGLDHEESRRVAFAARGLAVHLFNQHDYLEDAKLLSATLEKHFAEVAAVSEVVADDVRALHDIEQRRIAQAEEAEREKAKFAAEVTWETSFGLIFKDHFRISPEGIEYKGRMTPLAEIEGVTWGAVRLITNGVHTGTNHYFRWGSKAGITDLTLANEAQHRELVPRAWRAICVPILLRMLAVWQAGRSVWIGGHEIRDDGIVLVHKRMFRADERRFFAWNDMKKGTHNGVLGFSGATAPDFRADFTFRETLNAHVLDFAVDRIWEGKANRLGRIFGD